MSFEQKAIQVYRYIENIAYMLLYLRIYISREK